MANLKSQSFSALSRRMFGSDDEYRALSKDEKLIWLTLIGGEIPDRCGLFKGCMTILADQTGCTAGEIEAAFSQFERLGWIVRDGAYTLITGYILHQARNPGWIHGAIQDASAYEDKCPALVKMIRTRNQRLIEKADIGGRKPDQAQTGYIMPGGSKK